MSTSTSKDAPTSPAPETGLQHTTSHRETTSIDDHSLPKSVVVRLAKSVLPENTMMQKEAVIALMKSATVFVNYLAATANDMVQQKGKKTISNDEVLSALEIIDFDFMTPQLKAHIEQFEVARREKRKKMEQDEDGRKKRKVDGKITNEVLVEVNGEDRDTEAENPSEEGDSGYEREEPEERDEEDDGEGEIDAEEPEGEDESVTIDMEENDEESEEEDSDEALAEDSD